MKYHSDLLNQAKSLVSREPRRPKQASLRRAVSSAYYALFHLLIDEASRTLVTSNSLRQLVNRAFVHSEMYKASKSFAGGTLPKRFDNVVGAGTVPAPLQEIAQTFVDLQQARHDADYNLAESFNRAEVQVLVDRVDEAFKNWRSIRRKDIARLYLVSLLLSNRWEKVT